MTDNSSLVETPSDSSTTTSVEATFSVGRFLPKCTKVNEKSLVLISSPSSDANASTTVSSSKVKYDLVEFKVPENPPLKKPRVVLEEDQYAVDVERIIQRDFFPDLERLKAQNAYLSAVENNDIHMIRELYSKYGHGKRTPRSSSATPSSSLETPKFFETPVGSSVKGTPAENSEGSPTHLPMENRGEDNDTASVTSSKKSNSRSDKSLNQYLDAYTSEDNQSFQEFMDEADRKHRIKYSWLFEAERKHAENMANSLALPSVEDQAAEYQRPLDIDTWGYRNNNYVMYVPEGVPFTAAEKMEQARKKQELILENTRFKKAPFKETPSAPPETPSPSQPGKVNLFKTVQGKIGVDGKEIESSTPKVNGFSFVRTPSPNPGVEESPFMTWGEIEGTPFRLDGGDTPVPATPIKPYRILEQSKREKIGIELAEKVSQRYRDKKLKAIEAARSHLATPSPRPQTTLERLSLMSPAAQKLAKTKFGSRLAGDKALQSSYTPKSTPSRTPTPGQSSRKLKTPSVHSGLKSATGATPSFSTDNLLKLPGQEATSTRPKASDYF